jgi:hypothetical protein
MNRTVFVASPEELRDAFSSRGPFFELWAERGDERMALLLNGDRGWLMHFRFDGDVGLHSENPGYLGDPDLEMEFVLGNGQRDLYPARWMFDLETITFTLEHFLMTGERGHWITWVED